MSGAAGCHSRLVSGTSGGRARATSQTEKAAVAGNKLLRNLDELSIHLTRHGYHIQKLKASSVEPGRPPTQPPTLLPPALPAAPLRRLRCCSHRRGHAPGCSAWHSPASLLKPPLPLEPPLRCAPPPAAARQGCLAPAAGGGASHACHVLALLRWRPAVQVAHGSGAWITALTPALCKMRWGGRPESDAPWTPH